MGAESDSQIVHTKPPFRITHPVTNREGDTQKVARRISALDGLRALAMLLVFWFHVWEFSGHPKLEIHLAGLTADLLAPLGQNTRTDLFFVISGFCLSLPLWMKPESLAIWDWRDYARRRIRRIVPPYYAGLAYAMVLPVFLVATFKLLGLQAKWQQWPSWGDIVSHLTFTHMLFRDFWNGINGSLWTMSLEAQFYVAFPFVVFAMRRARMWAIGGIIALSLIYRVVSGYVVADGDWITRFLVGSFFLGRWMQFALGMLAAWAAVSLLRSRQMLTPSAGTGLVAITLALYTLAISDLAERLYPFPLRDLSLGIGFAALVLAACSSDTPLRRFFETRVMSRLGYMSYSLFLLHQPTAWYFSEFLTKMLGIEAGLLKFLLLVTCGFATVFLIAWPFFTLVEEPFISPNSRREPLSLKSVLGEMMGKKRTSTVNAD